MAEERRDDELRERPDDERGADRAREPQDAPAQLRADGADAPGSPDPPGARRQVRARGRAGPVPFPPP
ncbi:hypothetical protein IU11_04065 [Cellulosimicrobium sp. MM]|nr:hypothetical protein IU11_04065 [Cellulosimicrobium sp. MM]